jgi:hypothetical protein
MESEACHECGHPLPARTKICPRCGAKAPSHLAFWLGVVAASAVAAFLLYQAVSDFLHAPATADTTPDVAPDTDVGPGSKFASDHPDFLPNVAALIAAQGHKCPVIVDLWNEKNDAGEPRLEALCGPDANHADKSMHYAVYSDRGKVNLCRPWKEFGPDCL